MIVKFIKEKHNLVSHLHFSLNELIIMTGPDYFLRTDSERKEGTSSQPLGSGDQERMTIRKRQKKGGSGRVKDLFSVSGWGVTIRGHDWGQEERGECQRQGFCGGCKLRKRWGTHPGFGRSSGFWGRRDAGV